MAEERPLVGISTCLLGERVRWDAGHRRADVLLAALSPYVRWLPVCPEVDVGMGVPREPVELGGDADAPRMVGVQTGRDWTDEMRAYAARRVEELVRAGIRGFVLKTRSPSCGLRSAPVRLPDAAAPVESSGLFARALRERLPDLPIVEETDLATADAAAAFLRRVLAS